MNENWTIGIVSAVLGVILGFLLQFIFEKIKTNKNERETKRLGGKVQSFLDKDFLLNFEPGQITIDKIIEEFGKPFDEQSESTDYNLIKESIKYDFNIFKYKFKNAIVLFTTLIGEKNIISVTLRSIDSKYPINCPLSPATNNYVLGKAKIDSEITDNAINSWSEMFTDWGYSAIQANFFYKHVKYLTFTYIIHDRLSKTDNYSEFTDKIIDEVCISQLDSIHPFIYYYEKH